MAEQIEINQRVVYYGLRRATSSRSDISAGFARWREKFESKPLDVVAVVTDLVAHLGLDVGAKKALMLGMHSASAKLFDELGPVPTVLLGATASPESIDQTVVSPAIESTRAPEVETLERFMQLSSQYVKRTDSQSHKELMDILADEGLASARKTTAQDIKAWGKGGLIDMTLNGKLTVDVCQDIAHDYYVLLSEVIGPVASDTIINKTVDELLLSELSQRFNPRDLL